MITAMDDQEIFAFVEPANILKLIRERGAKGITLRMLVAQVVDETGISRSEARQLMRESLRKLERDGQVVVGRGKRYVVSGKSDLASGVLRRHAAGFGMVKEEGVRAAPIRIDPRGLKGAMDGDRVQVRLERARKRARAEGVREGVVVRILERRLEEVVGRWIDERGKPFLRPVDRRLRFTLVPTGSRLDRDPEHGDFVVASVDGVSARGDRARGVLLERLGRLGDPGIEERVVLRMYGIPERFPEDVLAEAEELPGEIPEAEIDRRWDLRDRPAITIDPVDARDFDDAVSASRGRGRDIVVDVHIADVSHFVRSGTALDDEGRRRGTSVYLPGRCVPMLPERVSSGLCTLAEGEDRLAYTVRYAVSPDGTMHDVEAGESVIHSRRRCTYGEVFGWLEKDRSAWPAETAEFADSLELLAEAADRLGKARRKRGSLDFELAEPEILLDPQGMVTSVQPSSRNRAHRLIEELMVAANRCVAELMIEADQPALHRVHDQPDPDRVGQLRETLAELGYKLEGEDDALRAVELQKLLRQVEGKPEERLVSMLVLRTMAKAIYSSEPARSLRAGGQGLPSLHLADPALPGSGGPPDAAAAAVGWPAGAGDGSGTRRAGAGRAWRQLFVCGAAGRVGRADGGAVEDGPVSRNEGGGGLRGHGVGGQGLRALRSARRIHDRRSGSHLGAARRLLPLRGGAAPAGGRADRAGVAVGGPDPGADGERECGEQKVELVPVG